MKLSRRDFLKKTGCALGMSAAASQMGYFGLMSALAGKSTAAPIPPNDYKALVVVFLAGGNDGNNTVIPNHSGIFDISGYQTYAYGRGDLAIAQSSLLSIDVPAIGQPYGLHPSLGGTNGGGYNNGIHPLWDDGKMAIVTNVGTLVQPTTRYEYTTGSKPVPYQLFSHADQIEQQQSAVASHTEHTGWGGRISQQFPLTGNVLPMMTSIAGSQLFITGGPTPLVLGDAGTNLSNLFEFKHINNFASIDPAFKALVTPSPTPSPTPAKFVKAANEITKSAIDAHMSFSGSDVSSWFLNHFPANTIGATSIGRQLLQIARLIKLNRDRFLSQGTYLANRQIFFCQLGGFDTHAYQLTTHAGLLYQFSQAVRAFYNATVELGMDSEVTTFTLSDFGRTMTPNGNGASAGSDHAWANHMFVVGGAVNGGNFYGAPTPNGTPYPTLAVDSDCDADTGTGARGRWIPTTSVEEYALVLANWFGLPSDKFADVFPNIHNFDGRCNFLDFLDKAPCL